MIIYLGVLSAFIGLANAEISAVTQEEKIALQIQREILSPWKNSWQSGKPEDFSQLFAYPASVPIWGKIGPPWRGSDGIEEYRWNTSDVQEKSQQDLVEWISPYLKSFEAIEYVDIALTGFLPDKGESKSTFSLRFDLRAKQKGGLLRADRGVLSMEAVLIGRRWKIRGIKISAMETLTAENPVFENVTRQAGLDTIPVYVREEAIRRGGYALAVGDFIGKGWPGIYVGSRGPGQLLANQGNGTYRNITSEAGLGSDTLVKAALFADMDNDGKVDITLQRFVDEAKDEFVFYSNSGHGKFKKITASIARKNKHDRPMSMAAADFNGDGMMDLYVGYPGVRDFTDSWISPSQDVAHMALYLNRGGWNFEEAEGAERGRIVRPHAMIATNIAQDGLQDLLVIDDRGEPSQFYLNLSEGRFTESQEEAGLRNKGWGMTAAVGDFAGTGRNGIYFTNIDLSAGHRILSGMDQNLTEKKRNNNPGYLKLKELMGGNRLYLPATGVGARTPSFSEKTQTAGVGWAGEAPAGAEWIDYNNDGLLDLYVANGLWSANPDQDYSSEFIQNLLSEADRSVNKIQSPEEVNLVMKLLQKNGQSFAGYQRNRLFRNNGDGTFTEVGYVTGADRVEDGYSVAFTDYNQDGRLDLLLRNADPTSLKWNYSPVILLKNVSRNNNKSLTINLKGRAGASSAIGAQVVLTVNGRFKSQEIRAIQGAVQNETIAFFGMKKSDKAESLLIRWPSGIINRYKNIRPGRIKLQEGADNHPEFGVVYLH